MRLKLTKSKNATSLYVIKSIYQKGKGNTSKIVEKLGTLKELEKKLGGEDPLVWAKKYIAELNEQERQNRREIMVKYSPAKIIPKDEQHTFNGGYLFLQKIYYNLGLHEICEQIAKKYKFEFDLNSILSRLIFGRIIFPSSKSALCELSKKFIEQPNFSLQHIYRALEILAKEDDFIQSEIYKNSLRTVERNSKILYYDCTNYFFEIEEENGIRQYGVSKEHRPNPIVQMGLFMDVDGIPLSFSINAGNTNEQLTLKPLEQKILKDFGVSKFVVCTDAGLSSTANRKFNDIGNRAFITTQSVKKLKVYLQKWALDEKGWKTAENSDVYDVSKLDEEKDFDKIFYKERWLNEDGLEQKMIVTFSLKYKNYQRKIRQNHIERAKKIISGNPANVGKSRQNDYKRFIRKTSVTTDGEIAEKTIFNIDDALLAKEEKFDGFYAVCTNLDDEIPSIIKVNKRRWEIEESFRIMKSEFKARPVYLSRDDRIKAHFGACFIALVIYRILEKQLSGKYTCSQIIDGLRNMNFYAVKGEGFIPSYTRTDFTDDLHTLFGFRTDYEIVSNNQMKNIFNATKI
jgi:transposase